MQNSSLMSLFCNDCHTTVIAVVGHCSDSTDHEFTQSSLCGKIEMSPVMLNMSNYISCFENSEWAQKCSTERDGKGSLQLFL